MNDSWWAILHVVSSAFMAGVIWFVQVVHYPLMNRVTERWSEFEVAHQQRTTFVVAPVMFLESLSTIMLWLKSPSDSWRIVSLCTLAMVLVSTFAVQVPLHVALSKEFQPRAHRMLVYTNFVRSLLWTSRVVFGVLILRTV